MKKTISFLLCIMMILGCMSGCGSAKPTETKSAEIKSTEAKPAEAGRKLSVVATIFPEYDWVMQILGDRAQNADVTMLLDNGVDLHSFQPTAKDIITISNCDVFIYVGGESDEWVEDALAEAVNKDMVVVNLLETLGDDVKEEEVVEGMEHEHDHEHEHEEEELTVNDIEDRTLSDFAGSWMSLQPMMEAGELDEFCEHKAEEDDSASAEDYRTRYTASWMCDVVNMTITDTTITFEYADGTTAEAKYAPAGYSIKFDEHGDISSVRYQFETDSSDAPRYVQFNDHGHEPAAAEHFHVYFGNEGFEAMMESATNPYFAPASMDVEEVLEMLMGHNHDHHHDEEEEEEAEYDEHVWLSLRNTAKLCENIRDALIAADPAGKDVYTANTEAYLTQLNELDQKYQSVVDAAPVKTLLFGDRFPFRYLVDDYDLTYYAAFVGCSAETEASFETIAFLANKVSELGLKHVMILESADGKIAQTIISTAGTNADILAMDSMQSCTTKDVKAGVTYLSIMEKNLEVLTQALQ